MTKMKKLTVSEALETLFPLWQKTQKQVELTLEEVEAFSVALDALCLAHITDTFEFCSGTR